VQEVPATEKSANTPPKKTPAEEYVKRMRSFSSYYAQLLVCIGILVAIGIGIAILKDVIIGACVAILGAILYVYFVSDELSKKLGLQYKSITGGITVIRCRARYGDTLYIPPQLIGMDVIRLEKDLLLSKKNVELTCLYLPSTLRYIEDGAFEGCPSLREIRFAGSEDEWNALFRGTLAEEIDVRFDAEYPVIPRPQKKKLV